MAHPGCAAPLRAARLPPKVTATPATARDTLIPRRPPKDEASITLTAAMDGLGSGLGSGRPGACSACWGVLGAGHANGGVLGVLAAHPGVLGVLGALGVHASWAG
jgi:hypothetical protein